MVRDICRRNGVHAAVETLGIPVEGYVGVESTPRSVQSSRWDGAIFLMLPGTSCQATIAPSLRDILQQALASF
jgi:hypothetical protein